MHVVRQSPAALLVAGLLAACCLACWRWTACWALGAFSLGLVGCSLLALFEHLAPARLFFSRLRLSLAFSGREGERTRSQAQRTHPAPAWRRFPPFFPPPFFPHLPDSAPANPHPYHHDLPQPPLDHASELPQHPPVPLSSFSSLSLFNSVSTCCCSASTPYHLLDICVSLPLPSALSHPLSGPSYHTSCTTLGPPHLYSTPLSSCMFVPVFTASFFFAFSLATDSLHCTDSHLSRPCQ